MKKNTPVFVISAFTGDDTNIGYIQNDPRVKEYITKPFDDIFAVIKLVVSKSWELFRAVSKDACWPLFKPTTSGQPPTV